MNPKMKNAKTAKNELKIIMRDLTDDERALLNIKPCNVFVKPAHEPVSKKIKLAVCD